MAVTSKDLAAKVAGGDVFAALELCKRLGPVSVSALVEYVAPAGRIGRVAFDTCADAWALWSYTAPPTSRSKASGVTCRGPV